MADLIRTERLALAKTGAKSVGVIAGVHLLGRETFYFVTPGPEIKSAKDAIQEADILAAAIEGARHQIFKGMS
ncbi:MAG TPA: hypothetical protein VM285_02975 [Polyangia bacterium]|nr:hypothetical protein [Thermoleophilia bacterium]HUT76619.1 hypothetical protein [Polyangia bacterium]